MHYYSFHIGDYRSGTSNLTQIERWVYRDLLDCMYDTEQPLPLDISKVFVMVGARSDEHKDAVRFLLDAKFIKTDSGYTNQRFESELAKYRLKADRAINANKKRWANDIDLKSDVKSDVKSDLISDANQIPTNNQEPITNKKKKTAVAAAAAPCREGKPDDVSDEVWDSFLQQRRKTKAVVTPVVINNIRAEAVKASISLEEALSEVVTRGWRSFKAGWISSEKNVHLSSTNDPTVGAL